MHGEVEVRQVGFKNRLLNDPRPPESLAFPACLTSLLEAVGEDPRWHSFDAHGRTWQRRGLYDMILAASGMAFGLLWHEDICFSSLDLMQVQDHKETIRYAFDYLAYDFQIVEKSEQTSEESLFNRVKDSIDAGRPVLAFGIVGPPECALVSAYDDSDRSLRGYSHFQSANPDDLDSAGRFIATDWYENVWMFVFCGEKQLTPDPEATSLLEVIHRGYKITSTSYVDGYFAGAAAYDAWVDFLKNTHFESMSDDELREQYRFHSALAGNHAEVRSYLAFFLRDQDDETLSEVADHCEKIQDLVWTLWEAAGGIDNPDAWKVLHDTSKRNALAEIVREIDSHDKSVANGVMMWYAKHM